MVDCPVHVCKWYCLSPIQKDRLTALSSYVREVLNSLTVAGFVRLEEGTGGKDGREARYWVPQACRAAFSKAGVLSFLISAVVKRYQDVLKCFQQDGPSCEILVQVRV